MSAERLLQNSNSENKQVGKLTIPHDTNGMILTCA